MSRRGQKATVGPRFPTAFLSLRMVYRRWIPLLVHTPNCRAAVGEFAGQNTSVPNCAKVAGSVSVHDDNKVSSTLRGYDLNHPLGRGFDAKPQLVVHR